LNAVALVSTFGDVLNTDELLQIFTQLLNKLKSEIKRQQTMKALSKIPTRELNFAKSVFYLQRINSPNILIERILSTPWKLPSRTLHSPS